MKKVEHDNIITSFAVSEKLWDEAKIFAIRHKMKLQELIKQAIRRFINDFEKD